MMLNKCENSSTTMCFQFCSLENVEIQIEYRIRVDRKKPLLWSGFEPGGGAWLDQ